MLTIEWVYVLIGYLLVINLLAFIVFGVDKHRAQRNSTHSQQQQRIPEHTLFAVALLGGSVGAITGMYVFHHKTQHKKFTILLPIILAIQFIFLVYEFISIYLK